MTKVNAKQDAGPLTVEHVADFYRRYPGETVTFYTRVRVRQPLPGFTVRVTIPAGLVLGDYRALSDGDALAGVEFDAVASRLTWSVTEELQAGAKREYQVQAQVAPTARDVSPESQAVVTSKVEGAELISVEETVAIAILAKGQYLRYLPALYQEDDLMGRFLMLFESFWAPIEGQIDQLPLYFDPTMTPSDLLPWLASWFNLVLDERLSEKQQRRLIQSAVSLYRKRGTKQGLQEYLKIYTGAQAQIIEHRANDFRLGPEARLGPGIALGTGNRPHTFTVILPLLPIPPSAGNKRERARQELERRRKIEEIIEAQKPAHTDYTLRIEKLPTSKRKVRTEAKRKKGRG